jgi:RHS repeat-associated protein
LTDASGVVTDRYDYDAFGLLIHQTGTTPNVYLYAGEQFDSALGFYYNRARYMNASTGRFFTMDSFEGRSGDPFSLHKYLYAKANPINRIDPSGHESSLAGQLGVSLTMAAILSIAALQTIRTLENVRVNIDILPYSEEEPDPERKPDPLPAPPPPPSPSPRPDDDDDDDGDYVYRVLREEENPSVGFYAKDVTANKFVRDHVRLGKKPYWKSQFISTTRSSFVALNEAVKEQRRVAVIDLKKVTSEIIDLTNPAVLAAHIPNPRDPARRYATASREVLVVRFIPSTAIKLVIGPDGAQTILQ